MATFLEFGTPKQIAIKVTSANAPVTQCTRTNSGRLIRFKQPELAITIDRIMLVDVKKGHKYVFPVRRRLKAGSEVAVAPIATEDDHKEFGYLVQSHTKGNLTELHQWLSIFKRPMTSNWTRSERLACVCSALYLVMLSNCMFYGKETAATKEGINLFGVVRVSWFTIWTSLISSVIVLPPTMIMGFIFKSIKRRSALNSDVPTAFNIRVGQLVDEDDPNEKKEFQLPFCFIYFAWICKSMLHMDLYYFLYRKFIFLVVAACIGVSAFFVFMYSLSWGKAKSLQWLASMCLHLLQDILIVQTIKVNFFKVSISCLVIRH